MNYDFTVDRNDLSNTRLQTADVAAPGEGEILIRVDRFALTANNITYGVAGDMIGYWQFFPAEDNRGRIPVWGVGTVVQSQLENIPEGTRYYGYFPMSSYLLVKPVRVSDRGFFDASEHRAALPPTYNQYSLMTAENGYPPEQDAHQMIYRPLFTTSFVIDDFFADNDQFGAEQIILASASSKTAFGTAYLLKQRDIKTVGLTSNSNKAFVESLGLYDEVLTYDEVSKLSKVPSTYVDMSGNPDVLVQVHQHLGDQLNYSCGVGITHWESRGANASSAELPGAKPTMFFAPTQIEKRGKDWGMDVFQTKLAASWQNFAKDVDQWVDIKDFSAPDELDKIYQQVLSGASPSEAYILNNQP